MKRLHALTRPASTAVVGGLVLWAGWLLYESVSLSRTGQRAIGECIGIEAVRTYRGQARGWVFRIAYRDAAGQSHRAVGQRGPGWPYLFKGDKIPIRYRPADPTICYPDSWVAIWGVTAFVSSVAALGVLYHVVNFFRPDPPTA